MHELRQHQRLLVSVCAGADHSSASRDPEPDEVVEHRNNELSIFILNQGEDTRFEEDRAQDVLEIITVFSARLYAAARAKSRTSRM